MAHPIAPYLLLIDDDEGIRESYAEFLSINFNVDTSDSIEDAISKLAGSKYQIAVIDMSFPDDPEGGLQIVSQISRTHVKTEAIVLSAHGSVDTCRKAFKKGAFDFIEKGQSGTRAKVLAAALEAVHKNK